MRRRLVVNSRRSTESVQAHDLSMAEDLLARFVARAYAADHPEFLRRNRPTVQPKEEKPCK